MDQFSPPDTLQDNMDQGIMHYHVHTWRALLCVFVFVITGPVMSASNNNLLKSWHASKLTCNLQETLPLSLGLSLLSFVGTCGYYTINCC